MQSPGLSGLSTSCESSLRPQANCEKMLTSLARTCVAKTLLLNKCCIAALTWKPRPNLAAGDCPILDVTLYAPFGMVSLNDRLTWSVKKVVSLPW